MFGKKQEVKKPLFGGSKSVERVGSPLVSSLMPKYEYKRRTKEETEQAKNLRGSKYPWIEGLFPIYIPKEKDNHCRILPPTWENPQHFAYLVKIHYGIGVDNGQYLCRAEHLHEPCFPCEEREAAYAADDKEYGNSLWANPGFLCWVEDKKDPSCKTGKLWRIPDSVNTELINQSKDPKTGEYLAIDDPEAGYDVYFDTAPKIFPDKKSGKTKTANMPTGLKIARDSSAISPEMLQFVLDHPLDKILKFESYNHIKEVMEGKRKANPEEGDATTTEEPIENAEITVTYEQLESATEEEIAEILKAEPFNFTDDDLGNLSSKEEAITGIAEHYGLAKTEKVQSPIERLKALGKKK